MATRPIINWTRLKRWIKTLDAQMEIEGKPVELIHLYMGEIAEDVGATEDDITALSVGTTHGAAAVLTVYARGVIDGILRASSEGGVSVGTVERLCKAPLATLREMESMTGGEPHKLKTVKPDTPKLF